MQNQISQYMYFYNAMNMVGTRNYYNKVKADLSGLVHTSAQKKSI